MTKITTVGLNIGDFGGRHPDVGAGRSIHRSGWVSRCRIRHAIKRNKQCSGGSLTPAREAVGHRDAVHRRWRHFYLNWARRESQYKAWSRVGSSAAPVGAMDEGVVTAAKFERTTGPRWRS